MSRMASLSNRLLGSKVLFLLLILVSFLAAKSHPLISQFSKVLRHNPSVALTRYSNHPPVNNKRCDVKFEANACEDVSIHSNSATAFIACGNPEGRSYWYPPSRARNAAGRNDSFREDLFKYDIKARKTTKLKIEGLDGDFISHGVDIYNFPDDPKKIHIFAVNHGRDGDSILIFSHKIGSHSVQLLRKVQHQGIKTANGVAANGPFDFFITNDHFFVSGVLRDVEDKFGPLPGASSVQYCDASSVYETHCRQVSSSYPNLNGIAISEDKSRLFVGDSTMGELMISRIANNKDLVLERSIELGAAADNIKLLPNTGDPIVAVFPTLENLPEYLANIDRLGRDFHVPSAAIRLVQTRDYEPEVVFWDDGSTLSYMTAATIDPHNLVFVGAGVLQYGGFVVCDLPKTSFE